MKKAFHFTVALAGILLMGTTFGRADEASNPSTGSTPSTASTNAPQPVKAKVKKSKKKAARETWVCPMGDYTGPKTADGKCPKCGMDLVKQEKDGDNKPAKPATPQADPSGSSKKTSSVKTVWICPMGDYSGDKPGKCPNCGMDLVEKK
jgi:rubrerythrin